MNPSSTLTKRNSSHISDVSFVMEYSEIPTQSTNACIPFAKPVSSNTFIEIKLTTPVRYVSSS
jgi:hypothetical protein